MGNFCGLRYCLDANCREEITKGTAKSREESRGEKKHQYRKTITNNLRGPRKKSVGPKCLLQSGKPGRITTGDERP